MMRRFWTLWLSALLYLLFAFGTHWARPVPPEVSAPVRAQLAVHHPRRRAASTHYVVSEPVQLGWLGRPAPTRVVFRTAR